MYTDLDAEGLPTGYSKPITLPANDLVFPSTNRPFLTTTGDAGINQRSLCLAFGTRLLNSLSVDLYKSADGEQWSWLRRVTVRSELLLGIAGHPDGSLLLLTSENPMTFRAKVWRVPQMETGDPIDLGVDDLFDEMPIRNRSVAFVATGGG